jgi:hypothetical protein
VKALNSGEVQAVLTLGSCFASGKWGVQQDHAKAAFWRGLQTTAFIIL